jgi:sporulation protein YlmC with PRC-barrel domain
MKLSELLGREVVSQSGEKLGHVRDVRGELTSGRLRITGVIVGKGGVLERYGIGTHGSGGPGQATVQGQPTIPWERIVSVAQKVTVLDGGATRPT